MGTPREPSRSVRISSTRAGSPQSTTAATVTAWRLAAANTLTTPVNLGIVHVNGAFGTSPLNVQNSAPASFSEGLDASFGANTGAASNTGGSVTNLSGGSTNASSLVVGLGGSANTATVGLKSGTVTVNLTSNGANSGLASTPLAAQSINVNGQVNDFADPRSVLWPP